MIKERRQSKPRGDRSEFLKDMATTLCAARTRSAAAWVIPLTERDQFVCQDSCLEPCSKMLIPQNLNRQSALSTRLGGSFSTLLLKVVLLATFCGVSFDVTCALGADSATYVTQTVPDNTVKTAGQSFTNTWTIKNSGTN